MKSLFLYLSIYTHNVKRFSIFILCRILREHSSINVYTYKYIESDTYKDWKDTQLIPSSPFQFFYRMIFTFITSNITHSKTEVMFYLTKKKLIPSDHDLFILTSIVVLFYVPYPELRPPSRCFTSHSFSFLLFILDWIDFYSPLWRV